MLTGRQQHIHFTLRRICVDLLRLSNQIVCRITLSGYNNHNIIALLIGAGNDICHVKDAFSVRYRTAAKLLNNQTHRTYPPLHHV